MDPKIKSLRIENYRAIRKLRLDGLSRVNLIAGCNNSGKSSVLEAIRILVSGASPEVISDILRCREEYYGDDEKKLPLMGIEDSFPGSSLFTDFPEFSSNLKPVSIFSNGSGMNMEVRISAGLFMEQWDRNGMRLLVPKAEDNHVEGVQVPAFQIVSNGKARYLSLDSFLRFNNNSLSFIPELANEHRLKCLHVSPYIGERTDILGTLWDKVALTNHDTEVMELLRLAEPDIMRVSVIGGAGSKRDRTAIVRSKSFPNPVPLRTFGDGLSRLFVMGLFLVNAQNGFLLIDEFENGVYYTTHADIWRKIFKLAIELDVQIFATSHSWDTIAAFQKATEEYTGEGTLIRLDRGENDIVPTQFPENELAIAVREHIEVR